MTFVPDAVCYYRFRDDPDAMYRQRYAYAYYRAKLRRQYAAPEPFLTASRWVPLLTRVARQTLSRQLNRMLGRCQSQSELARSDWLYAGVMGELRGSLAHRVPPAAARRVPTGQAHDPRRRTAHRNPSRL